MLDALTAATDHKQEFESFDEVLRKENPSAVARWEKEIEDFDADPTKPCPYIVEGTSMIPLVVLCCQYLSNVCPQP